MPAFIPLALPAPTPESANATPIRIKLKRGATTVNVDWPASAAADCSLVARVAAVIRIEAVWLGTAPLDMRAGTDSALARVVAVLGAARPHHAYCFANRRANRMKVLVHDGIGVWLAARRLHQGRFIWAGVDDASQLSLSRAQLDALVLGLPWQRVGEGGVISIV